MGKIAFIFPGQGAQYKGMGQDFFQNSKIAKEIYQKASECTGINIEELCFQENDKLNITEYTQIAMVTTEIAMLRTIEEFGIKADIAAGLSLGEYTALAACGACSDKDLFNLVRKRGIYMQEAYPVGGAMSAVLGLDSVVIERICQEHAGVVGIANYNCPGQVVISGEETAVSEASKLLVEAGAKRCIPLKVSGPFHSPLLAVAGTRLKEDLLSMDFMQPAYPYISNVTADVVTDYNEIPKLLELQVSSSVRWQQTIEKMIADGVTDFIEIGPGKTLAGFVKKINAEVRIINIEKYEDIETAKMTLLQ